MYVYDHDQGELLENVIREILLCTKNVFKTFEEGVSGICSQRNQAFCSPTTSKNIISRHQEHPLPPVTSILFHLWKSLIYIY